MASGMDALFFLDADLNFDGQDFINVLRRPEAVVGGTYRTKEADGVRFTCWPVMPYNWQDGVIEMESIGTGFLRIKREVFERMEAPAVEGTKAYFNCRVEDGKYLGEDYAFCKDWREQGGTVWAYPSNIKHCGRYEYEGDFHRWLRS